VTFSNPDINPDPPPINILAVDDDPLILDVLHTLISDFGYQCKTAQNGAEALGMMEEERFDIVVTDMVMPRVSGMELLQQIRAHYPRTDVIVVTGHLSSFSFTDVIRAGAMDFISKPFNRDELEAKINRVLRERGIIQQLEKLSMKDGLTGLYNRRYFDKKIWEETQRAHRQGYNVFLALIDIDNFKKYNDTKGHQAGDELLCTIGDIMVQCIRKNVDWAFRYGGDEFAMLLPQTNLQQAVDIGNRLLERFGNSAVDSAGLSIGLAKFIRQEIHSFENDVADLIGRADKALYKAKESGRGRMILADDQ